MSDPRTGSAATISVSARVYIYAVAALGAAVLVYGLSHWYIADWARFLFLLGVGTLASGMKVTLSSGAGTMSMNFLFILIGVFMFRRSGVTRTRDLGRVGIGLGLMLIALQHLLTMITPYEDVPSLRMLLGAVTGLPQGRRGRERTARRKTDSNSQSHPRERVYFGDKPTQIPKAMSRQTNGRRRP